MLELTCLVFQIACAHADSVLYGRAWYREHGYGRGEQKLKGITASARTKQSAAQGHNLSNRTQAASHMLMILQLSHAYDITALISTS